MVHEHVLLTIPAVTVTHLHNGQEAPLAQGVPLNVSVVEVPFKAPGPSASGGSGVGAGSGSGVAGGDINLPPAYGDAITRPASPDIYLVIRFGDLMELPLSALDKVVFQYPDAYIIPVTDPTTSENGVGAGSWGSGDKFDKQDGGGYVRMTLGSANGSSVDPEDRDMLDAILASWTTFNGGPSNEYDDYANPSTSIGKDSKPSMTDKKTPLHGHLALVDEHTGHVVGDLSSSVQLDEEPDLLSEAALENDPMAAKEPVVIQLPDHASSAPSNTPVVAKVSRLSHVRSQYGQSGSKLVASAEWISRGILFGSETASNMLSGMANSYMAKHPPTESPLVFNPRTRKGAETVQSVTKSAVMISGKAAHYIGSAAAVLGDRVGKTTGIQRSSAGTGGEVPKGTRGLVNKSLVAFNTVFDALEHGGKHILESAGNSANSYVTHRYGEDAGQMAKAVTGTVQGVALVYVDIRGVSRKAILKSAGKAAIKGRMSDGRQVVLAPEGELTSIKELTGAQAASSVSGNATTPGASTPTESSKSKPNVWSKFK